MHGISLMEQLQDQDVYAGIVPTIPNQSYEAMIQAKPDLNSAVGANTFASHWNLSQGKLSRIVFLHALRHGFVLMGDEVLLQHSQFFKKHPTMVAEVLKQLEALEHALILRKNTRWTARLCLNTSFTCTGQSFNLSSETLSNP